MREVGLYRLYGRITSLPGHVSRPNILYPKWLNNGDCYTIHVEMALIVASHADIIANFISRVKKYISGQWSPDHISAGRQKLQCTPIGATLLKIAHSS